MVSDAEKYKAEDDKQRERVTSKNDLEAYAFQVILCWSANFCVLIENSAYEKILLLKVISMIVSNYLRLKSISFVKFCADVKTKLIQQCKVLLKSKKKIY